MGGWANRDTVKHFADYGRLMFERLGDRVPRWVTHNEPSITAILGHQWGVLAPGIRDLGVTARVIHHLLLSHGLAVQAFRASGRPGEIGITTANTSYEPADDRPETLEAVEAARDFSTRLWHGPVFGRGYPERVARYYESKGAPLPIEAGDLEITSSPTEFLGVNLYSRAQVLPDPSRGVGFRNAEPTLPLPDMGYEAAPHSLGDFVRFISDEYDRPLIYITENGVCDNTGPKEGIIEDTPRVELLRGLLVGLAEAIRDGADVRAYYVWSLLDNFEWVFGYSRRFGIVWVDYETQRRIPKASAELYRKLIQDNGLEA